MMLQRLSLLFTQTSLDFINSKTERIKREKPRYGELFARKMLSCFLSNGNFEKHEKIGQMIEKCATLSEKSYSSEVQLFCTDTYGIV